MLAASEIPSHYGRRQESSLSRLLSGKVDAPLEEQLESLKSNVFLTIISYYKDFVNSYQYRFDMRDEIAALAEQIEASPKGTTAVASRERELNLKTISLLEAITKLHVELQGFDQLVESGEMTTAADSVMEMGSLIERLVSLKDDADCPPEVLNALKKEVTSKRAHLQQRLEELFSVAYVFISHDDYSELKITSRLLATIARTYFDSPINHEDVKLAMAKMNSLEGAMRRLSRRITATLAMPIMRDPSLELTLNRTKIASTIRYGPPSGVAKTEARQTEEYLPMVFDKLLKLAQFLKETVFSGSSSSGACDPIQTFADSWSPELASKVLSECLMPSIPEDPDALSKYHELVIEIRGFDENMKKLGMFQKDQNDLLDFTVRVNQHYAQKRRADLLMLVRDILQSDDQNTVEVPGELERGDIFTVTSETKAGKEMDETKAAAKLGGKDGLELAEARFKLPTCHVSKQAQALVELAHQTLESVATADDSSKIEAFYCARDIFDCYRAVIPVHHADSLENIPGRTMLFYNDCEYICFHLLAMGYKYSTLLPYPLKQMGTFLDMVPSYRKLGEGHFRNQLRKQRDELLARLAEAGGFGSLSDDMRCEQVEKAIKAALYHLNGLVKAWKPIMPLEMYLKSMGILVDVIISAILSDVAERSSWTNQEGHQLRYLMSLIDKTEAHFHSVSGVGKNKEIERAPIPKYSNLWEVYRDITDMLEAASPEAVLERVRNTLETVSGKDNNRGGLG
ncbi:hypothetical protein SpCBS45565_g06499 [Spizellomyces sp. 'palustris']|nr:hypothetical protein SpCBS45565_g06499 [Spizellomyces sp. 'palustris']